MVRVLSRILGIRKVERPNFQPGELVAYNAGDPPKEYCRVRSLEEYKTAIRHDVTDNEERSVRKGKRVCVEYPYGGYIILPSSVLYRVSPDEAAEDIIRIHETKIKEAEENLASAKRYRDALLSRTIEKDILFVRGWNSTPPRQ